MKRSALIVVGLLIALVLLSALPSLAASTTSSTVVIDPKLAVMLNQQPAGQPVSVIVVLRDQVNARSVGGRNRAERRRNLVQSLRSKSDQTQSNLRALLVAERRAGHVQSLTPLWVVNAIAVTADQSVIDLLSKRPEVSSIVLDSTLQAPPRSASTSSALEPNVSLINAPALWSLGYRGQGVVVANMDTGVDYTHPDLAAQWRGGTNSWFDPYGQHPTIPTDVNGHGTWTMGVMVGRDNGGTAIGVAPDAQWIAVKIFNDSGTATASKIHLGFQWLLDPDGNPQTDDAPDLVNNSWDNSNPGCDLTYEPDLQALVAGGIMPVFAAGNSGPTASTSVSPANNPEAFSVGATDNNNAIYTYSSRGPTSCGGTARTFPDVVAPGVNIYSSDLYGGYWWSTGTSLAAPHVSGAIALLLSAFPNLTVDQQRAALTSSALDLGAPGADNTFGAGRIDVLSAYNSIAGGGLPTSTPTATETSTPLPGDTSTPTSTPSSTATFTATPTPTATSTPTPTSSPTPTATPTSTPTPTNTSAPTATATRTSTRTATPTRTSTRTATPTRTNTPVPSPTSTPTVTLTPTSIPEDAIFNDGFESGNLNAWSSATTGGGRLSVTANAALSGAWGMQALINNTSPIYVTDQSPNAETSYHARFYFSPNGMIPKGTGVQDIFAGYTSNGTSIFKVQFRRSSSSYQIRGLIVNNSGGSLTTNWYTISNASHTIEIAWQAAASGSLSLWIDGALKQTRSGVATGNYRLEEVRLGPSNGITSGSTGAEYFDGFVSTRNTYIGP